MTRGLHLLAAATAILVLLAIGVAIGHATAPSPTVWHIGQVHCERFDYGAGERGVNCKPDWSGDGYSIGYSEVGVGIANAQGAVLFYRSQP